MRKHLFTTTLLLAPLAMASTAIGSTTDCGSTYGYSQPCAYSQPAESETSLYNQDIRVAAGELQIRMSILANEASKFVGQRRGGREIERAADKAAMEAWNFKQLAGLSNVREWVKGKLDELSVHVTSAREAFERSGVTSERLTLEAYNAASKAWTDLSTLVDNMGSEPLGQKPVGQQPGQQPVGSQPGQQPVGSQPGQQPVGQQPGQQPGQRPEPGHGPIVPPLH